jgi:UDP:flavonoid glycosyltransferase YjiC (YdhE family)
MGIVQKALGASVPVVAVPFGRDQPEVGRRLRECGAGRVVSRRRLRAERLRAAVREAIADRSAAAAAGTELGAGDPPGAFADHCEDLAVAPRALAA